MVEPPTGSREVPPSELQLQTDMPITVLLVFDIPFL